VDNIEQLVAPKLLDIEANKQQEIDRLLLDIDGTENRARLGANATISVSMAIAKAAAKSSVLPLYLYLREFIHKDNTTLKIPVPLFNLINGGKHVGGNIDLQEFLLMPASSKSYDESLQMALSVFHHLENDLRERGQSILTSIEGGYGPNFATNAEAISLLSKAIGDSGFRMGYDAFLGIDAGSNYFYRDQQYHLKERTSWMNSSDVIGYYTSLTKDGHVLYLEDPLSEDDWEGWSKLHSVMNKETLIIGDDLISTNPYRLQMALDHKAVDGVVVKPNQIGTVIEALAVVEISRVAGMKIIVSGCSGETSDDFIADFAVAVSADYVKFGAPNRGEHVVKYNRLLEIEKQLTQL
jgi:enolase